jgi:hypothetical protein
MPRTRFSQVTSLGSALEERVAEHPIVFGRAAKGSNACVEGLRCRETDADRTLPRPSNHGGERLASEPIGEVRSAPVDVDHAGGDTDGVEPSFSQQRVELPTDVGVSSAVALQSDEALDGGSGMGVVGMETDGSVVALDHCDRPFVSEKAAQNHERVMGA